MLSRLFVPDTFDYMIAGYVILTVVLTIYIASLAVRWQKAKQEVMTYKENE